MPGAAYSMLNIEAGEGALCAPSNPRHPAALRDLRVERRACPRSFLAVRRCVTGAPPECTPACRRASWPTGRRRRQPPACRCPILGLRQAMARTRASTAAAVDAERERTRHVARIGNNLNPLARWANRHALAVESRRGGSRTSWRSNACCASSPASARAAAMHIECLRRGRPRPRWVVGPARTWVPYSHPRPSGSCWYAGC